MSKNINDEVSKRIKIFIQHLGITTAEFCRKTGLSRQTVDKFKAGIHGPSVESLDKIIKSYPELRLNWLVSGEGMMVERITDDEEDAHVVPGTEPYSSPAQQHQPWFGK